MPTYDFICNSCQKRFDIFMTFSEYGQKTVQCMHCDSEDVRRRMTKVRIAKSTESRMESMEGDLTSMADLEDNPRALGQMMRKMGGETGESLPAEFNEVVERLESGQSPEDIESAMPDLGSDISQE